MLEYYAEPFMAFFGFNHSFRDVYYSSEDICEQDGIFAFDESEVLKDRWDFLIFINL